MKLRIIIRGFLGYIPGLLDRIKDRKERTGTISARYCYSVWLRHLVYLNSAGITSIPRSIGEIGPGASLGVGLAALLTGTQEYFALDTIRHSDISRNILILDELFSLFTNKTDIPGNDEFPKILPSVQSLEYPYWIIDQNIITVERKEEIKTALLNIESDNYTGLISLKYFTSWTEKTNIKQEYLDLIFSQAVLEHILDLPQTFNAMKGWLRKEGMLAHQIDYKAHETHKKWNGHWYYSDWLWKIILKGRSYPINRKPHSYYKKLFTENRFKIILMRENTSNSGIKEIPRKSTKYEPEDMIVSESFFIAQK